MTDSPSPFIAAWIARVARLAAGRVRPPAALDVAMGRGRHTGLLAEAGFKAFGVDRNPEALAEALREAARHGLRLHVWAADLEAGVLPSARFDLLVCARYLQRSLFGAIRAGVKPGGVVLYETFTVRQRSCGAGPRSPDHLLGIGELRQAFEGWAVLEYLETEGPEAVARLAARKPASPGHDGP